jgi:PAS domain S-box-containing protein
MENDTLNAYKVAFDSTLDAIICSDASNLIIVLNTAAEQMFGYSHKEALGQPITMLMPSEYRERHNNGFKQYTNTGKSHLLGKTIEVIGLNKSGNTFPLELTISHNKGSDLVFTAVLRDITDRKLKESFDLEIAKAIENEKSALKLSTSLIQTINAVALTTERRDPLTAGHMKRVAELSVAIGSKLGIADQRLVGLSLGASIHDIGKIYIASEILNRPGKLSNPEFDVIKAHSQVGHDIIAGIEFPWPIRDMVLSHHERMDGTGYPNGLQGDEFTLEAQIIAVADVMEAVVSHRPYRAAQEPEAALDILKKNKGSWYNPEAVDACVKLFEDEGFEFTAAF